MLTPIEQSPSLVFDPARQQITPPPPVLPQPLQPMAETPVQKSDTPDQNRDYQQGKGSGGDVAYEQKEQSQAAQKLRAAWAYLQQLKSQAAQALSGSNSVHAKRIALEAADVASNIETIALQIPIASSSSPSPTSSGVQQSSAWLPPIFADVGGDSTDMATTESQPTDVVSLIDLARQGLNTAKEVVSQAATLPHFSLADRSTLDSSMRKVIDAMASVESLVQKLSAETPMATETDVPAARIDVKA